MTRTKKAKILIIDDDENIRMLLEFVLQRYYEVVVREDGISGMSWLADGNIPDLIIADVEMPRLNGIDLLRTLRESGLYRNIPVVILSGFESEELKQKLLDMGAEDYLRKPFQPEKTLACIERIVRQQNAKSLS